MPDQPLPEGTDRIVEDEAPPIAAPDEPIVEETMFTPGPDDADEAEAPTAEEPGAQASAATDYGRAFFAKVDEWKAQGSDQARAFAQAGIDSGTAAIDDVVRMINEAADQIDERVGTQYGAYARRTAEGIDGFGELLRGKDVDELFDQARDIVRKSPAIAVGAAAALGFVVARLARAGFDTPTPPKGGAA